MLSLFLSSSSSTATRPISALRYSHSAEIGLVAVLRDALRCVASYVFARTSRYFPGLAAARQQHIAQRSDNYFLRSAAHVETTPATSTATTAIPKFKDRPRDSGYAALN